jgi:hypothetical protein
VPTSLDEVHASLQLAVTFPASGKLLVELTGFLDMASASRVLWGIRIGSTDYELESILATQVDANCVYSAIITGTPYSSVTMKWVHLGVGSGQTLKLDGPNGYKATMKATQI